LIGSRVNSKEDWTECYIPSRMRGRRRHQNYVPSLQRKQGRWSWSIVRRLPCLGRVRWREPAVTELTLTVTYLLIKGIRGSRPSKQRVKNSRQGKRSIARPIARKRNKKARDCLRNCQELCAHDDKKPENQEWMDLILIWLGPGGVLHT
jgi:hypothetical protein